MSTNVLRPLLRAALGLGLALSAAACTADASEEPVANDPTSAAPDAGSQAEESPETTGTTSSALSTSCTATHDGGKWCCAEILGRLRCWKVPPPPPPDTIYTFK